MSDFLKKLLKVEEEKEKGNKEKEKKEVPQKEMQVQEGMIAVDLYQTENELVLLAPIAGVSVEDLEVLLEENVLTIKGERKTKEEGEYLIKECYFGPFSRELVLPEEVDSENVKAFLENGMLEIRLPLARKPKEKKIIVQEK